MFTATDEAYALTIVLNQTSNWIELSKPKEEKSTKLLKKMFTKPQAGYQNSWNMQGQLIFLKFPKKSKD